MNRSDLQSRFAERGRAYWPLTFALIVLVLVGSMSLGPVLRGSAWWWVMAAVAAITLLSAGLFRHLRWGRAVVSLGAAGVLVVTLTLFFGAGSGLLWLVPTPSTFEVWGALVGDGLTSIQQQAVPAVAYPGIVFLVAIGAGAIALVIDAIAITLRMPAIAGALVLVPVAVPSLVSKTGSDVWTLILTAAAYLLLLRVDVRLRRSAEAEAPDPSKAAPRTIGPAPRGVGPVWSSLGVGAVAVTAALILSAATPAISASSLLAAQPGGVLFGNGVNPLVDLGQDLRRPEASAAFHYSTSSSKQPYFKLLTLDQFSEDQDWVASHAPVDTSNTVDRFAPPPGLGDDVDTDDIQTHVQIDGVVTSWLPVPYPSSSVSGVDGDWTWADGALTVSSTRSTTRGQSYDIDGLLVKPTADQSLRAAGSNYPTSIQSYLNLPDEMPESIASTATEVTAGTTNPYDAAIAMQRYFRSSTFAYSVESPVADGYDGSSLGVIAKFLEVKKGYCIHFASAMAVMARSLGIPSRLALGYLPGTSSSDSFEGLPRWNVSSHDLHTWPELYFPGVGWVAFEPTTGRGSVPDYAQAAGSADLSTFAPSTNERKPADAGAGADRTAGTLGATDAAMAQFVLAIEITGIALGVVLLALIPLIVRRLRRLVRRTRVSSGRAPPSLLWREVVDTATDYGVTVPDTETARHLATRLLAAAPDAEATADPMGRLLDAVEHERYARPGTDLPRAQGAVRDLDEVVRSIRRAATRPQRLRGTLLPRSLWPAALTPERGRTPTPA